MTWPGDKNFTLEDALKYRYGQWGGNPRGFAYDAKFCAYEITENWHSHQCYRKPGFGVQNLYCKQHAKKVDL